MSPRYLPSLLILLVLTAHVVGEEYPAQAMEKIREAVKFAEDARKQYHEKLELIRTRLTQVAEKGKANKALIVALAKGLGLKRSQFELVSGATQSDKRFLIRGITHDELSTRISKVD